MTHDKLLQEWFTAAQAAEEAKAVLDRERELRQQVADAFFPSPVEGTNTSKLENGWVIKSVHKLDRKVDEAVLPAVLLELRKHNINADLLFRYKPELNTKPYRELTKENRQLVDGALTIKPGLPTVTLVPPKDKT